jgi:nucleolar protein 14
MPSSQLKMLKASLRQQGIVGPQKSKKQRKQNAESGEKDVRRVQRNAALSGIREQFNPFEFQLSARGPKFDVTSDKTTSNGLAKKARPGVKKAQGEEMRKKTLLVELQRRNKVGGILDRRFGENDPSMAPEDKMLERFTQEKQRRHKNSSAFDLEDEEEEGLTHMGESLSLDGPRLDDDFDEGDLTQSDADDDGTEDRRSSLKRRRDSLIEQLEGMEAEAEEEPGRKRSKQEIMKEVMAKSKLYKYERQAAKEEDDDIREQLDQELPEIHALLRGVAPPPKQNALESQGMNPERAALLRGEDKGRLETDYDVRLKQLKGDKRSQPTERTKTEEEAAAEEAHRLQELEARRLRRMKGEELDEPDHAAAEASADADMLDDEADYDVDDFGLGSGIKPRQKSSNLGFDDEDDFIIDDDLVASGSDIEISDGSDASESDNESETAEPEDEDEFVESMLKSGSGRPEYLTGANAPLDDPGTSTSNGVNGDLSYTWPCPISHAELLEVTQRVAVEDLPTVVKRIRALHHPQLKSENKGKLAKFTVALVDHISHLATASAQPPFEVLESLIRHIHSLSRTYPVEVANAFRRHLEELSRTRPLSPSAGDLVLLVAIGAIFPTSDHFHQVVTPAMLCMTRFLGQKIPHTITEHVIGILFIAIGLSYQKLSKRYIPEMIGFLANTLSSLAPTKLSAEASSYPRHESRIAGMKNAKGVAVRNIKFEDAFNADLGAQEEATLKASLIGASIKLVDAAADMWIDKSAFQEVFEPALSVYRHLGSKGNYAQLPSAIQVR